MEARIKSEVTMEYWNKYHLAKRINDIAIKNFQVELNGELSSIENFILDRANQIPVERYSKEWLIGAIASYYDPASAKGVPTTFVGWLNRYLEDNKDETAPGTLRKNKVVLNRILKFEKYSQQQLRIKDINLDFKMDFERFCKQEGYHTNTIAMSLRFVKTVCNYAAVFGEQVNPNLKLIRIKEVPADWVYLNEEEIEKIATWNATADYLDNARDWLLISCYTGQRIGDFMRFEKSMIRYQKNRKGEVKPLLEFIQEKTGKEMSVPLSSKVLAILDKRDGEFPRILSDQKYNEYIKLVCQGAKINERVEGAKKVEVSDKVWRKKKGMFEKWELVSSHIGRRSFATNNYGKIPTVFLMNMTGHSTEQMFLKYIGKGSNDIAMELSEYFD
ncbi:phage integrase SAM-like domain-containing protein [Myroides sp. DF42-4-2]|uniref:phage integrase SAM-like domain-containing protein n=1 Tax=unclassified Myroides TaxID=2642485 RepID=UPI0025766F63|nr:phage integrase SAM-like domain-containing protein [Myroides sp. DF42-4-2]MDM1408591.1 site-specific integrase [Myroides sp. DF42-4-2]